jgi:hypothetical protein
LVEIRGLALHVARAYLVVGLIGAGSGTAGPWMDGLMGFVQVDREGRLCEFPAELTLPKAAAEWESLQQRMQRFLKIRVRNGKKVTDGW